MRLAHPDALLFVLLDNEERIQFLHRGSKREDAYLPPQRELLERPELLIAGCGE